MPRKYTRMEFLSEEIFRRKANGETNLVLLLAAFVLALPQTFAKNCSPVLPHNGLKFGTSQDAKL